MPDSFTEDPNGLLYVFNGQDPVGNWDGRESSFRESGVFGPTAAPVISGSGTGNIVGRFYARVRFVDDRGNFSNVSPVSDLYEAISTTITISDATFASPIQITTTTNHGLATGQSVHIKNVSGNTGANGIRTVTVTGPTTFTLDSSFGSGSYTGGGTMTTGVSSIDYSSLPVSSDSKVARRQVLRNKDGNADVYYVDIDTTNLASTSLSSTSTSLDLGDPVPLFDDEGVDAAVSLFTPPPDFKAVGKHYKGRMFSLVDQDESQGCLSLTSGSPTVTGIETQFRESQVGRFLTVPGHLNKYEIQSVTDADTLTLVEAYSGSTDPYSRYTIRTNDSEGRTIYWSEAGLSEAWPPSSTRTLQADPNAGRLTGALCMSGWLYFLAENRIYRFTYVSDPNTDSRIPPVVSRGCLSDRLWAVVDGVSFVLDRLGVHAFVGTDTDPAVGNAIQEAFRNNTLSTARINWERERYFHCVVEPSEGVIRWFVCLDGARYPKHALCLHYRSARWWTEEYPFWIASSCRGKLNDRTQVFLGSRLHRIVALEKGPLDGPDPSAGTTRGTVTSATAITVSDSTATFPSGLTGWPISIVSGKGKGQQRLIAGVSSTKITVKTPWNVRPDTTSTYQIGGITYRYKSLWFDWAENSDEVVRAVGLQINPTAAASQMDVRVYQDMSTTPLDRGVTQSQADYNGIGTTEGDPDLELLTTKDIGYFYQRMDAFKAWGADGPRFVSFEIRGTAGQSRAVIRTIRIEGVSG